MSKDRNKGRKKEIAGKKEGKKEGKQEKIYQKKAHDTDSFAWTLEKRGGELKMTLTVKKIRYMCSQMPIHVEKMDMDMRALTL